MFQTEKGTDSWDPITTAKQVAEIMNVILKMSIFKSGSSSTSTTEASGTVFETLFYLCHLVTIETVSCKFFRIYTYAIKIKRKRIAGKISF
jgi:hypothetical protein